MKIPQTRVKWKLWLTFGSVLMVIYLCYAILHFEFNPFANWNVMPKSEQKVVLEPKRKTKRKDSSQKELRKQKKKKESRRGKWTIHLKIQGNILVLEEVYQKNTKKIEYPPKHYTLDEFGERLEEEGKYKKAYFRLHLNGQETYGLYIDLCTLIGNHLEKPSDDHGTIYFRQIFNF